MRPASERKLIASAIQFEPTFCDPFTNIGVAQQLAFEAVAKGAQIIVLPELCMGGNSFKNQREAYVCAQTKDGYQTQALLEISRQFGCYIVFGYVELHESRLFNSAAVIGPFGLASNVRKHNLFGSDNMWATPGEGIHASVCTPWGRLGVLISRDLENKPVHDGVFYNPNTRFYHQGSIDIIALPVNWVGEYSYPETAWVDLATSLNCSVIVSNRVGFDGNVHYRGGSCIIDRNRKVWTNGNVFDGTAVVGGMITL